MSGHQFAVEAGTRVWIACDDGGGDVEYPGDMDPEECASDYAACYDASDATQYVTVRVWPGLRVDARTLIEDRSDYQRFTVEIEPREPECSEPDHDWRDEGTWGSGPGVSIRERCANCGAVRRTNTGWQDPSTGEYRTRVRYESAEST